MPVRVFTSDARHARRFELRMRLGNPTFAATNVGQHGTRSGYTSGCRCDDCTDAEAAYCRQRAAIVREFTDGRTLSGRWALDYDCCTSCGTDEVPHAGRGLCDRCRMRQWRKRGKR